MVSPFLSYVLPHARPCLLPPCSVVFLPTPPLLVYVPVTFLLLLSLLYSSSLLPRLVLGHGTVSTTHYGISCRPSFSFSRVAGGRKAQERTRPRSESLSALLVLLLTRHSHHLAHLKTQCLSFFTALSSTRSRSLSCSTYRERSSASTTTECELVFSPLPFTLFSPSRLLTLCYPPSLSASTGSSPMSLRPLTSLRSLRAKASPRTKRSPS